MSKEFPSIGLEITAVVLESPILTTLMLVVTAIYLFAEVVLMTPVSC